MLQKFTSIPYNDALGQVKNLYNQYANTDNKPADKDARADYVELSGTLGPTHVNLGKKYIPQGYSEEVFGFTQWSQSVGENPETRVVQFQRGGQDNKFALSGTEIVVRNGQVLSAEQLQEERVYSGKTTLSGYPLSDLILRCTPIDTSQAVALFQALEAQARG